MGMGLPALSAGIGVLIAKSVYLEIDKNLNTGCIYWDNYWNCCRIYL